VPDLIFKQWVAVIDARTTIVCLNAAGQIRAVTKPFDTLNGEFDEPPAHIHCRAMVVPFLAGAVNTQRDLANVELQARPVKYRDPRKMTMPPKPRVSSKPLPAARPAAVKADEAAARKQAAGIARDLTDLPAARTGRDAIENRAALAAKSSGHADFADAVANWTGDMDKVRAMRAGEIPGADSLRSVLQAAGRSDTVLYRGMAIKDQTSLNWVQRLKRGDAIENDLASSFTASQKHADRFLSAEFELNPDPDKWTGIKMEMRNGHAVDVSKIGSTPYEKEWLTGRDLYVVDVTEERPGAWRMIVETR
jgi:hypothetical protein